MASNTAPFSFNFRGRNSRDFGILANHYDLILPEKRSRKQAVPFRNGSFDHGAQWYNERILRLRCVWLSAKIKEMTRADLREVSYWLSSKGRITLDTEPDKSYIGEIYGAHNLEAHYIYHKQPGSTTDGEFTVDFLCEPFAQGELVRKQINSGVPLSFRGEGQYKGTAITPCLIVLRNNTPNPISGVTIMMTRRRQ